MKKVAVANRKGGVGKSTTAAALMAGLSLKGYKVLAVDLDGQRNLTRSIGAEPEGKSIMGVLMDEIEPREAIQKTSSGFIIPSSKALSGADVVITQKGKDVRLRDALSKLEEDFDFCIIDCPPALGILTVNALCAADCVIIPAQADIFSLDGIEDMEELIRPVRERRNERLTVQGVLLTRYSPRSILSRDAAKLAADMAAKLGTSLYRATIRDSVIIKEAQISRQSLFEYAPKANVTEDYRDFIKEFLKRIKEAK